MRGHILARAHTHMHVQVHTKESFDVPQVSSDVETIDFSAWLCYIIIMTHVQCERLVNIALSCKG